MTLRELVMQLNAKLGELGPDADVIASANMDRLQEFEIEEVSTREYANTRVVVIELGWA